MANDKNETWNFGTLLGQGTIIDISYQLTSPKLFLPFLYMALGAPVLFAGLILPVVQVSNLVSQVVSARLFLGPRLRKWYLILSIVATAAALTIVAIASYSVKAEFVAALFLFAAAIMGMSQGVSTLAYQDLIGRILSHNRRSSLIFTQAALAAVFTILIALASQNFGAHESKLAEHLELLWAGIALTLFGAIVTLLIREAPPAVDVPADRTPAGRVGAKDGIVRDYLKRFRAALSIEWFRRFLIARSLFLSVEMAMPFYALHAATYHSGHSGSLSTFVMSSSVGVIVGGMLWQRVARVSMTAVMALAPLVACAAGVVSISAYFEPDFRVVLLHAGVFMLIAMANEGTRNARKLYIVSHTSTEERPYYIALTNVFIGILGTIVSFGFGALAHFQHVVWPICLIVALNLAACVYSRQLSPQRAPAPA